MHSSGIRVSSQNRIDFSSADSSTSLLRFIIEKEEFTLSDKCQSTGSLSNDIFQLQSIISKNNSSPCYILFKPHQHNLWYFIFFMPLLCSVRERMIYSSSISSLRDGISFNCYKHNWNISSIQSISLNEFESFSNLNDNYNDVMSTDEREAQSNTIESQKSIGRSNKEQAIVGLKVKIDEKLKSALITLKLANSSNSVMMGLSESEILFVDSVMEFKLITEVSNRLSNEPRYLLILYSHIQPLTSNLSKKTIFIYYCPDSIRPRQKMFYSTCKSYVISIIKDSGIIIDKSLEFSDKIEINDNVILNDLYPTVNEKQQFAKPMKPGKWKKII